MPEDILVATDWSVATVTLNRPRQRNAITFEMWRQLRRIAAALSRDDAVRAVVVRGAGDQAFSAGADIKDFRQHRFDSASAAAYAEQFEGALDAIEMIPKPVISMIRGACVGGGLELATATDLRMSSEDARFGVPIARIGVVAGYREVRRLVALGGAGNAARLLLTGEIVDSAEALRMGLVNSVLAPDVLEDTVYALANEVAGLAPLSHAAHKSVLRTVVTDPGIRNLPPGGSTMPLAVFDSDDFREGTAAFLEKRRPKFHGR